MSETSTVVRTLVGAALLLALASCAGPRPIHPYRLEGFPGAPIEPNLFPLKAGARWVFRDQLATEEKPLVLELARRGEDLVLKGAKGEGAVIRERGGFVEIVADGAVIDRPYKLEGVVGDTWELNKVRYIVFGYDEIEVLGARRRALVVAAERTPVRDIYWFVEGIGWARIRTERLGAIKRDAILVEHTN